jgi:non-hemolytic enterotoxin B/C
MTIRSRTRVYSTPEFSDLTMTSYSASEEDVTASSLVKENMSNVHTNSSLVQTYIAACLTQKDIKLDKIKSLEKTQQETREHARYWLDNIVSKINATYTDVAAFCNLSSAYWDDLIKIASEIQQANDEHAQNFKLGISELKENIQDKDDKTQQLIVKLSSFRTDLESDNRNFQDIVADADRIYAGSEGEIETTRQTITAITKAIDKDIGLIAGGAVAIVGGIVMIGIGAVGSVVTGGAAAKLIVVGVITTVTGVAMVAAASVDLQNKQRDYSQALEKLKQLENEMAALENAKNQFTSLKDNNTNAHTAIENMRQAWITINNNFQGLEDSVNIINPERRFMLVNKLKAAQKNFDDLKQQAVNSQKNGSLEVKLDSALATSLRLAKTFYSFPTFNISTKRLTNPKPWILPLAALAELTC